eukprot:Pgem_evm3s19368
MNDGTLTLNSKDDSFSSNYNLEIEKEGKLGFTNTVVGDIDLDKDNLEEDYFDPENPNWTEEELQQIEYGLDWRKGITWRTLLIGSLSGIICSICCMKILLYNAAVTPGWSLPSILIAYLFLKFFTWIGAKFGKSISLNKYELVCTQTLSVAVASCTAGGGYGTYLATTLSNVVAFNDGITWEDYNRWGGENNATLVANLSSHTEPFEYWKNLVWALSLIFGSVNLVTVLRYTFIVRYNLPFPSPTAAATLIESFTETDGKERDAKVGLFGKLGGVLFIYAFFNWLFTGTILIDQMEQDCTFMSMLPLFGGTALSYYWYINLSSDASLYTGIACLTPRVVNWNSLLGGVVFWALVYPLIWERGWHSDVAGAEAPDGYWFVYGAHHSLFAGMSGYKTWFMIMCIFGNGLYIILDMMKLAYQHLRGVKVNKEDQRTVAEKREEGLRIKIMEESTINKWILLSVFIGSFAMACVVIPFTFKFIKWYQVLIALAIYPLVAIVNCYLSGLTDTSLTALIAKGLLFVVGSWFQETLGTYEGLPALMFFLGIIAFGSQNASDIMGDYKTAYILKCSSKSMYICEMIGLLIGAFVAPAFFLLFTAAGKDYGFSQSAFPINYAGAYIGVGQIALQGLSFLPEYSLELGAMWFVLSFIAEPLKKYVVLRLVKGKRARSYIMDFFPNLMVWGLYAYLNVPDYVLPLCIGWWSCEIWQYLNATSYVNYRTTVGSAIVVGVGMFAVPTAIFGVANLDPPLCMTAVPYLNQTVPNFDPSAYLLYNHNNKIKK